LRLQGKPAAGNLLLNWQSIAGRTYNVEYSSTLGGSWQTLSNNLQGTGAPLQVQDSLTAASARFYHLQVSR
jgi:hypothetical protein